MGISEVEVSISIGIGINIDIRHGLYHGTARSVLFAEGCWTGRHMRYHYPRHMSRAITLNLPHVF
jgi:hypothetical protein